MRLDHFDLNLLVMLDALLEERNVTRASQRVHIGQSAASAALARLREHFGDELLAPVGRRLELTPLARTLVQPVRDTLLRARATIARRPGFDAATEQRHFVVCASDYVVTVMLAAAVRRIAAEAPGLVLDIRSPPKNLAEAFDRGTIDLLILPEQYVARLGRPFVRLFEDSHVCMVWSQHGSVGAALSFEQYMALGHVAVRFGAAHEVDFEDWFVPPAARQRRIEGSVDNFATLPSLVIGTQRVATLHARMAMHFARLLPLRVLPAPFELPPVVETMAWPPHLEHDPAHIWLRRVIQECAACA